MTRVSEPGSGLPFCDSLLLATLCCEYLGAALRMRRIASLTRLKLDIYLGLAEIVQRTLRSEPNCVSPVSLS